jgi:hypothetical protein
MPINNNLSVKNVFLKLKLVNISTTTTTKQYGKKKQLSQLKYK